MFYEQLKPNKVINHCKSVLKYTHQCCQQTLVKPVLLDGLVNFCFKHSSCFLQPVSHFLIFLVKQTKIALFKISDKLGHNTSKETWVQSYVSKLPNSSSVRVQQPWSSDPRSTIKKATAHIPSASKRLFLLIINTKAEHVSINECV